MLEKYFPNVIRFAMSLSGDMHLAEDLAQETMVRALRARNQLQSERSLVAWLLRITFHVWCDDRRRRMPIDKTADPDQLVASHWIPPLTQLIQSEEALQVFQCIQELPEKQKQVIFLSVIESYSHQEIADIMDMTVDAVKSNLCIARRKLREQLAAEFELPDRNP